MKNYYQYYREAKENLIMMICGCAPFTICYLFFQKYVDAPMLYSLLSLVIGGLIFGVFMLLGLGKIWKHKMSIRRMPVSPVYEYCFDEIVSMLSEKLYLEIVILAHGKKKCIGCYSEYSKTCNVFYDKRFFWNHYVRKGNSEEWIKKQLSEVYPDGKVQVLCIGDKSPSEVLYKEPVEIIMKEKKSSQHIDKKGLMERMSLKLIVLAVAALWRWRVHFDNEMIETISKVGATAVMAWALYSGLGDSIRLNNAPYELEPWEEKEQVFELTITDLLSVVENYTDYSLKVVWKGNIKTLDSSPINQSQELISDQIRHSQKDEGLSAQLWEMFPDGIVTILYSSERKQVSLMSVFYEKRII